MKKGKWMNKGKEVDVFKTILGSIWIWFLTFFFCINAILYARDMLLVSSSFRELIFWATLMIVFIMVLGAIFPYLTMYVYKKEKKK